MYVVWGQLWGGLLRADALPSVQGGRGKGQSHTVLLAQSSQVSKEAIPPCSMEPSRARQWKWQRLKSAISPVILVTGYSGIAGWYAGMHLLQNFTPYLKQSKEYILWTAFPVLHCWYTPVQNFTIKNVYYRACFLWEHVFYDNHYEILFIVFVPWHCGLNATLSSRGCVLWNV